MSRAIKYFAIILLIFLVQANDIPLKESTASIAFTQNVLFIYFFKYHLLVFRKFDYNNHIIKSIFQWKLILKNR